MAEDSPVARAPLVTVTRVFHFCAGHRLLGHEGKCRHMHGHNYEAEVTVAADTNELDALGMVIDFSLMDDNIGKWIDDNWDHGFVLNVADNDGHRALECIKDQKSYATMGNPTAEVMASELMRFANAELFVRKVPIKIVRVLLRETPKCSATVEAVQEDLFAATGGFV